jgi:hypothetical protein
MSFWLVITIALGVVYLIFRDEIHRAVQALMFEAGFSKDDGGGPCDSRY